MRLFLLALVGLLAAAQGTMLGDLEDDAVKLEELIKRKSSALLSRLEHAVEAARERVTGAGRELEDMVTSEVDQALLHVGQLDPVCAQAAKTALFSIRGSIIMKIINCPYIEDALDDIQGMVYASKDFVEGIVSSVTSVITGVLSCMELTGSQAMACILRETVEVFQKLFDDAMLVEHFIEQLFDYTKNATLTIYRCATREELHAAIQTVLVQAHECHQSKH